MLQFNRSSFALLIAIASALPLCSNVHAQPPIAAFVQPDAVTRKPPHDAFTLTREGKLVSGEVLLQPCDQIEFVTAQTTAKEVRITTMRGGKNIVLSKDQPRVDIACEKALVSDLFAQTWMAIAGGNRGKDSRSAASKGLPAATRSAEELSVVPTVESHFANK